MNVVIADLILQQLKRKSCSVESHERRSACDFSVENVPVVYYVFLRVSFDESHCSSCRKSGLRIFQNTLPRDYHSARLCASQVFVGAQVDEVDLIESLEVEFLVAAIGCTVDSEDSIL